jgi:hypothetical protein
MEHRESTVQLRKRLSEAKLPMSEADRAALRRHVFDYVEELKGLGWPPERVIVAVKGIAREAGIRQSSSILRNDLAISDADRLLLDVVGWCIEKYFSHDSSEAKTGTG